MNDRECLRTPTNIWRSFCDHCDWWRIAFVRPFAIYSPLSGEFAANIFFYMRKDIRHSVCVTSINDPYRAMFRAAVSDSISEVNTNTTASERWTSAEHVLQSAAETNIGKTAATTKRYTPHCSEMAAMSAKQRQLKLWHQNTRNNTTREDIKRQRNITRHATKVSR